MSTPTATDNTATGNTARYRADGILFPVEMFSRAEIGAYRSAFDEVDAAGDFDRAHLGNAARHFDLEFVWRLATYPPLLALMEQLMGPDLLLLSTDFFIKHGDPTGDTFVAWHQDVTFWGLEPAEAHTAWIAIDDSDVENGCMRVIPGSHRHGIVNHGTSERPGNLLSINQEIPDDLVDSSGAADVVLAAGEVSIHDGHLFHASMPNRSLRRRAGFTVRFIPPHVRQKENNSLGTTWRPILVAGEDRYHHFTVEPAPFPAA